MSDIERWIGVMVDVLLLVGLHLIWDLGGTPNRPSTTKEGPATRR